MTNVCKRNCLECNLQPTLEAKQMCASFKAVAMLSYIEGEVIGLKSKINRMEPETPKVVFNMDAIAEPADAPVMPVEKIGEEPEAIEPEEELEAE